MITNPSLKRPDQAKVSLKSEKSSEQPNIGMVSLGCPKALVDSERILTRLRAEGYGISPDYKGADAVIQHLGKLGVIMANADSETRQFIYEYLQMLQGKKGE